MTDDAIASLTGSRSHERAKVDAYLGDTLVAADLDVDSVSLNWDATRQVQCQGSVLVADPEGALAPWVLGDTLAPGARLQITWICEDGSTLPRALMVVTKASPGYTGWAPYELQDGVWWWMPQGGTITLEVEDLTSVAIADKLQAPGAPSTSTCVSEVRRLLGGIIPVVDETGSKTTVAASTVYERERMDAVDDLVAHAGLQRRLDGAGVMHLINHAVRPSVWRVDAGHNGALVKVTRSMSLDRVFNSVVASSSATSEGEEFVGRAYRNGGPARWNGPLGNRTQFYSSPLLKNKAQAEAAARTRLDNLIRESDATSLDIETLPHPGLELWDRITVPVPDPDGNLRGVDAVVQKIGVAIDRLGVAPTTLTCVASSSDLVAVMRGRR